MIKSCFQYIKGTKKKANHNDSEKKEWVSKVVSNTSKVLKRKQITTLHFMIIKIYGCFQYIKGTKKKANHNQNLHAEIMSWVVSNTSKVLKRKQITTRLA